MASGQQPIYQAERLAAVLQPANVQLGTMVDLLTKMVSTTKDANQVLGETEKSTKKQAAGLGTIISQLRQGVAAVSTTALSSLTEIGNQVNAFTRKFIEAFRPDVVKRFDLVTRDLLAVIGEAMVPIMERATVIVRAIADTLNGLFRAAKPLIDQGFGLLDQVLKAVGETVKQLVAVAAGAFLPVWQQMLDIHKQLVGPLTQIVGVVGKVLGVFAQLQTAIIGAVVPVLQAVIPLVGVLADVLATILPNILIPFKVFAAMIGPLVRLVLTPLMAVVEIVGKNLAPFVEAFRELGQMFGELYGELTSLAGDVLAAVVGLFGQLVSVVAELLQPVRDLITLLARGFVSAIREVVRWVVFAINAFREMIGLPKKDVQSPGLQGSSTGKAQVGANFTSPDDLWKKVALSTAAMGRQDPVKGIQSDVGYIRGILDRALAAVQQTATNTQPKAAPTDHRQADMWRNQELRRG